MIFIAGSLKTFLYNRSFVVRGFARILSQTGNFWLCVRHRPATIYPLHPHLWTLLSGRVEQSERSRCIEIERGNCVPATYLSTRSTAAI